MRFLIVSDIHGRPTDIDWLTAHGPAEYVTLGELCGDASLGGAELHAYLFEDAGIQKAVLRLRDFAKDGLCGLGFSAGGTVLWRAASEGLPLKKLVCISSTRLRFEHKLTIPADTFWGELDVHIPRTEWLCTIPSSSTVYEGLDHNFYDEFDQLSVASYRADVLAAFGILPDNRQRR